MRFRFIASPKVVTFGIICALSGAANPSAAAEPSTDCYFPVYPVKAFYATTKLHAMRTGPCFRDQDDLMVRQAIARQASVLWEPRSDKPLRVGPPIRSGCAALSGPVGRIHEGERPLLPLTSQSVWSSRAIHS
jgi:hypothetical protein